MKLPSREVRRFLDRPEPPRAAILIYGEDAMRVADARTRLTLSLLGETAVADMRLDRMHGSELRKNPAQLADAVKATGFFPGARAVLVEDAPDSAADPIAAAMKDWRAGDATIIVTAGQLRPASPLRKLFETAPDALAIAIYSDPPDRDEVSRLLEKNGIVRVSQGAMEALLGLATALDPGDFGQLVTRLSLYKLGDAAETSAADVEAIAPATTEADLDQAILAVAEGRAAAVAPTLGRLAAQGATPVGLCSGMARHFRQIHAAACDSRGPEEYASSARLFGPRRDRIVAQARRWGPDRLERALEVLIDTDLALRSPRPIPAHALVERACIRIAMLCPG